MYYWGRPLSTNMLLYILSYHELTRIVCARKRYFISKMGQLTRCGIECLPFMFSNSCTFFRMSDMMPMRLSTCWRLRPGEQHELISYIILVLFASGIKHVPTKITVNFTSLRQFIFHCMIYNEARRHWPQLYLKGPSMGQSGQHIHTRNRNAGFKSHQCASFLGKQQCR
jgi:hypothetical protein